jgi:hypothetical protein
MYDMKDWTRWVERGGTPLKPLKNIKSVAHIMNGPDDCFLPYQVMLFAYA